MSKTFISKLVYGVKTDLVKFNDQDDAILLMDGNTINNVEYFESYDIFGEVVLSVESDDILNIDSLEVGQLLPDLNVFKKDKGFKIYLILENY